jgi:trehalose 6-phosphate phosphatase
VIPDPERDQQAEHLLQPLVDRPEVAAVLCDLDGTLVEIVARPELARVTAAVRQALARIADRFAETAVITGRRATVARSIVGIQKLTYVGNHGFELLLPDAPEARPAPDLGGDGDRAAEFAAEIDPSLLERAGLRLEDKGPIVALHWRGASSEEAAEAEAERIATEAEAEGLVIHRGRKVLELRPSATVNKGTAVEALLAATRATAALYAGDDRTDLDAFAVLARLRDSGRLGTAVRIGIASAEGPPEIAAEADLAVPGPAGLLPVLRLLAG